MKRSDMLNIIKSVIKLNHFAELNQYIRGEISAGRLAEILSESVLSRIEKEGMLPPHNQEAQEMSGSMAPSIGCCQWGREDLGPHKTIPDEAFDALVEDLLADGICPCGSDSYEGCSVTGCPLYCQQELIDGK